MPRADRLITPADLMPRAAYAEIRRDKRAENVARKRNRRLSVGPYVTVLFESWDSMWLQVQEMLYIEGGGADQAEDELRAYNPMIPKGRELTATLMFEIDDRRTRQRVLGVLAGVEERMFIDIDGDKVMAVPEGDVERSRDDGKTSAVHFLHFPFSDAQIARFRDAAARVTFVIDHPDYGHMAIMPPAMRAELATDFAG